MENSSSEDGQYSSSDNSNNSVNDQIEMLNFVEVKSKRGYPLLTRDGFEYSFEKNSAINENVEYWRFIKVSLTNCTVSSVDLSII
ncbi:unnamed protein product [Meloidogyne enterolobii]|uniref:Uncharacterized protein n=2 Tax=Meloidogyne enterolobii TaxID=390850 RepID=A0A6V7XEH3_MELEN|nr:unnamed protein product [Meloidogyne enterolobii]